MKTYVGTMTVEFEVFVEANSLDEAQDMIESIDLKEWGESRFSEVVVEEI